MMEVTVEVLVKGASGNEGVDGVGALGGFRASIDRTSVRFSVIALHFSRTRTSSLYDRIQTRTLTRGPII